MHTIQQIVFWAAVFGGFGGMNIESRDTTAKSYFRLFHTEGNARIALALVAYVFRPW